MNLQLPGLGIAGKLLVPFVRREIVRIKLLRLLWTIGSFLFFCFFSKSQFEWNLNEFVGSRSNFLHPEEEIHARHSAGFPEPRASEIEMFSKSREFWGQWFVVSKLRWLNFQWALRLLRRNTEVLTLSFLCILNKYGVLSGDVHLDCKFHYENVKHVT